MKSGMWNLEYILLAALWILWCTLHSFLIAQGVTSHLKRSFGDRFRYYRVFFNLVSVGTLIPVLVYSVSLRTGPFFNWSGIWRVVQLLLTLSALGLFYAGGRHYDLAQFLGIRQVSEHESAMGLTDTGMLDTSGILGVIRHPWYAGGILIIWARPLDMAAVVTNTVLTMYLLVGTILEERKLVQQFGDEYRDYQERVPMFFPGGRRQKEEV